MPKNHKEISKLSPKQVKAMDLLLAGLSKSQAAAAVGVLPRTMSRWIHEEKVFGAELQRRSSKAIQNASTRLTGTLDLAIDTLRQVMEDTEAPASVRVRSANFLLSNFIKLLEISDIQRRMEALEQKVELRREETLSNLIRNLPNA